MAYLSGKSGSVAVAGTDYAFGVWELEIDGDDPSVLNFTSAGAEENVEGPYKGMITLRGPYNSGAMAMTRGTVYTFTLRASGSVTWSVSARVKTIRLVTDVKDAVRVEVRAQSNGAFTPSMT